MSTVRHQAGRAGVAMQMWQAVCKSRGTPAPDPAHAGALLRDLGNDDWARLEHVMMQAAHGRERPGELVLLSWAAACTRPSTLARLQVHGLNFTSAGLFSVGLGLTGSGWDMSQRLAQLSDNPDDVEALRALLAMQTPQSQHTDEVQSQAQHPEPVATPESLDASANVEACITGGSQVSSPAVPAEPDTQSNVDAPSEAFDLFQSEPPAGDRQAHYSPSPEELPTRFERQAKDDLSDAPYCPEADNERPANPLQLRLFGKSAAHTLTITPHRRGDDFFGVNVVTIESAHPLAGGAGFDWRRKLVIQLIPEEMPGIIATLIGIQESAKFGHHGSDRTKFIELRRQNGGIVVVTGDQDVSYTVPVRTTTVYYVLDLFCRAMAMNAPGRTVTDILALVKSVNGY